MKKGIIFYWALMEFETKTGYKHKQEIPYEEIFKASQKILESGLNVMLFNSSVDTITIFIDDRRFTQR